MSTVAAATGLSFARSTGVKTPAQGQTVAPRRRIECRLFAVARGAGKQKLSEKLLTGWRRRKFGNWRRKRFIHDFPALHERGDRLDHVCRPESGLMACLFVVTTRSLLRRLGADV